MLEIRKLKKEEREASFRLNQYSFGFWTDGTYERVGENGRLHLQQSRLPNSNRLTAKSLSALVFGTLSVEELIHRGWCSDLSEDHSSLLNRWFPNQFIFNSNKF